MGGLSFAHNRHYVNDTGGLGGGRAVSGVELAGSGRGFRDRLCLASAPEYVWWNDPERSPHVSEILSLFWYSYQVNTFTWLNYPWSLGPCMQILSKMAFLGSQAHFCMWRLKPWFCLLMSVDVYEFLAFIVSTGFCPFVLGQEFPSCYEFAKYYVSFPSWLPPYTS